MAAVEPQTGRRRAPAALYRAFRNRLVPAAFEAAKQTGYSLATYRTNRDRHYSAVDAAIDAQLVHVGESLQSRNDDSVLTAFQKLRHSMWTHRDLQFLSGSAAATGERLDAEHARHLAALLRILADEVDAIRAGLTLRAEDHENDQAISDFVARWDRERS
ncbi:hypothetical protein [Actinomadura decatromicini]|uniref:Uncharacterized protein n=1 Tax=Actinomadura decatromicini TaxID=2604572 RepID=A0A5D3FGQ9_9ACTN|nr:hypothetical protein [Actinomadura decatromicini]TYK47162.1 hypothetical protein FXF68_25510 [Actinomadura decatromicini]